MDRRKNHKGRVIFTKLSANHPMPGSSIYKEMVIFDKHHIHVVIEAPQVSGPLNLTININAKNEVEAETN